MMLMVGQQWEISKVKRKIEEEYRREFSKKGVLVVGKLED